MTLRHRRRAFVNGALGLRRPASIANSYSELRHQLSGWIRGSLFIWHIVPAWISFGSSGDNTIGANHTH